MDLLKWQLSDGVINGMSNQLNIGDSQKTETAAQAALTVLMTALAKNSTSSESAISGLSGALERDHDGSILDDVMGLISGQSNVGNAKTLNGAGILGHLLGGKQSDTIGLLTKMTGLENNQSAGLLMKLAPMVLGVLGRYKKQNSLDKSQLSDFLRTSQQEVVKKDNNISIFEKLLDQDGDGSVMDEVASIGMKVLGNFFKR
ncbi:MAG: DUF937 domain-containing protein [Saprospiraceae bacterium]|nr:DUF937 domain-containing protein [Bacteroidia bacterium]NNE13462.1 DUF937 domain-containing protein [Saprospiraceae bacterium]